MNLKKKIKHIVRDFLRLPLILNLVGTLAGAYVWLVGKTGRFDVQGLKEFEALVAKNDGGIFVTWHGRALMLPFFWRNTRQMKALVSPHHDGRIIARLLRMFHIQSIDGSSDRHALGAALEIVRELNCGTVVSLISDGPRGPSMRLNKSVIYFAQKTGKPVMGFTYSAKGAKIAKKSWDSMLIPPLFCCGVVRATKPLFVPAEATEEELDVLRQEFENELNTLTFEADKSCGLPEIAPGCSKKIKRRGEKTTTKETAA